MLDEAQYSKARVVKSSLMHVLSALGDQIFKVPLKLVLQRIALFGRTGPKPPLR